MNQSDHDSNKKSRYFVRPDSNEKPLSFWEILVVVLSSHLGVRSSEKRLKDFRRANGLHVFIAGVVYFVLLIIGLIVLVQFVTRQTLPTTQPDNIVTDLHVRCRCDIALAKECM